MTNENPTIEPTGTEPTTPPTGTEPIDIDEFFSTNKKAKEFLNSKILENENRLKKLFNTQISEKEKLDLMSQDEKIKYWESKALQNELSVERYKKTQEFKTKTIEFFNANKIPINLIDILDFDVIEQNDVYKKMELLKTYDFFSKGSFEKAVEKAVNEKIGRDSPKTGSTANTTMTKEQFNKLSYLERAELFNKDETLYNILLKGE
ncbi:MAG: hypothetical protein RR923_02865 [Bacilli bacterium]